MDDHARRNQLFIVLAATFVTALIVANCIAGRVLQIGPIVVSVGVIPFPITFLLTDVVNEYYGKPGARFLTLVGLAMLLLTTGILAVAGALPTAADSYVSESAYQQVFGLSARLFVASLCAYLLGQLSDIFCFHLLKRVTGSRMLWLRATGSTALSQVVDTAVVNYAVWLGVFPAGRIAEMAGWSYLYKMAVAVALTPLLYVAHWIIVRRLGIRPLADD
jgi:uncharacterized integral membrane protein (TIGR00697 family)